MNHLDVLLLIHYNPFITNTELIIPVTNNDLSLSYTVRMPYFQYTVEICFNDFSNELLTSLSTERKALLIIILEGKINEKDHHA